MPANQTKVIGIETPACSKKANTSVPPAPCASDWMA